MTALQPIEQRLCKRLADIFSALLPGVKTGGNWLPEAGGLIKGPAAPDRGERFEVSVHPRGYDGHTSALANFRVALEYGADAAFDPGLTRSVAAFSAIVAKLERWQDSIAAVKEDLTLEDFTPAGLHLEPGEWTVDADDGARRYEHGFTLRGRVSAPEDGEETI